MKSLLFIFCLISSVFSFSGANAQVVSSEPKVTTDLASGERILMPAAHAPEVGQQVAEEVFRNVAQRRTITLGRQQNGYYQMPYGYSWGTEARFTRFNFGLRAAYGGLAEPGFTDPAAINSEIAIARLGMYRHLAKGLGAFGLANMPMLD